MRRIISILIIALFMFTAFTGCSQGQNNSDSQQPDSTADIQNTNDKENNEKIKIGIVQPIEHPSLNQIRESIIEGLKDEGLKDRVDITYKDAQGDPSNINTIVSQFVGDKMDVIVPIGTGTAQSAAAATKEIPIVFAAVSYPVEAGLVEDLNKTDGNITGVSDAIDVNEIFNLALTLTPNVKTFGFIYNSGEVNSVAAINKAKEYCDSKKIKYTEANITNSSELLQASQSLIGKVDAIFTPTDNTVAAAMPMLSAEAMKAGIPVYTGADSMVADGGFATVGVDYTVLGKQVAAMIKKIIDGEKISDIPIETLKEYTKIYNKTTAEKINVKISDELLKEFRVIE